MIFAGIDVETDKCSCLITDADGDVLSKAFTIPNNAEGIRIFYEKISMISKDISKVKIGIEFTDYCGSGIFKNLLANGLTAFVINPVYTRSF